MGNRCTLLDSLLRFGICACKYKRTSGLSQNDEAKDYLWEHLLIVLFSPLAAPVMLFVLAYHSCINLYYRNRPRPLPKRMRKYMKKDCVLDEDNQTVSLAEYNYMHATEYTLDDVYGKGYVESLTEKERANIATEFKKHDVSEKVQESIPDIPEVGELWL